MRYYTALPFVAGLTSALTVPSISGFNIVWSDNFAGNAGDQPGNLWTIAQDINVNHEVETYTESSNNLQLSGGGSVQFVPQKSASGNWTSGRIESKAAFTPVKGKEMIIQGSVRFGSDAQPAKQGVWPAFWLLGDAVRHGTPWPQCGELDIMEQVDGVMTGYGTAHCGTFPGGPCNESNGLAGTTAIPDNDWHTWTIRWNLISSDWTQNTITWYMDGQAFHTISGSTFASEQAIWSTLANSPFYIIMNVAIGGDWPGPPNGATDGGWGAMMEVGYAAVYQS